MVTEKTDVWLAFPPLVETNFGSFYPSTPVLAAYLESRGIRTEQTDLNEEFALWLLRPAAAAARASDSRLRPDSPAAAAGRWLSRHHDKLFDEDGRHRFGPSSPYGHVLQMLAQHYLVDPGEDVLDRVAAAREAAEAYRQFYSQADLENRLPEGISLIGISVPMGPQLLPALTLAEHAKSIRPDVPVVLGGPALSLMSPPEIERLMDAWRAVDAIVRFDGEIPLHELARLAKEGRWDPAAVAGVSSRVDGAVQHNAPGTGPAINSLPAPLYPPLALAALDDPVMGVTQARGCYWGKCDYCDFIELYDGSPPFRGRRPDLFVAELKQLASEFGVSQFSFITESIPPAFARRVCAAILEEGLRFRWTSFAMVDRRFDRELLAQMVAAGCEFLVVGMETTITRVLKLVHKSADREENLRFLRDAREVGLPLVVNLIPDLPTTTYDEAMQALEDIEEFAATLKSVSVFPFEPTRSSNVGRNPQSFGLDVGVPSATTGQAQYALNHLISTDPAMTPEQRAEVHDRYRAFANRVNGGDQVAAGPTSYAPDTVLRIALEDLDLFESDAGLICSNMRARSRAVIPPRAAELLRSYLDGTPFSPGTLGAELTPEVAVRLIENLDKAAMLVPSDADRVVSHG